MFAYPDREGGIGAVLVFLALAGIGVTRQDERTVRGAYLVMAPAAWFVLVPLAHAALLSGIALSLGTPWGLIRHYWVALKLVVTAFSTVILMIYMGTSRQMAGVAADPVVELGRVRNPSPLLHAIVALVDQYNRQRPHQALNMKVLADIYRSSSRPYHGLEEVEHPFTIAPHRDPLRPDLLQEPKDQSQSRLCQADGGIKQVDERIWLRQLHALRSRLLRR